jgi:hypothetical protein
VAKGKLTRQELGWLLTQEAQGAAERLRKGVTALTQAPPPPGADAMGVDATLHALDDAMKMLSTLHSRPVSVRGRRGRIDLASLLWEVAPDARVSIEPGSGTEVFGDESELRRMLHLLLGHGTGTGSAVTIKRDGDEVVVSVVLGPDSSATAETERAWLARMALRYGGRWELEGSTEVLALPAEGLDARDDVARLRKELDEARAQGEAYARELAAAWTAGSEPSGQSSYPPPALPAGDRHAAVARLAGGVASTLRAILSPVERELAELVTRAQRRTGPEGEPLSRLDGTSPAPAGAWSRPGDGTSPAPAGAWSRPGDGTSPASPGRGRDQDLDPKLESMRRKLSAVGDFVAELAAVGEVDPQEPQREVDLVEVVGAEARSLEGRAGRAGVTIVVRTAPEEDQVRAPARVAAGAAAIVVRELIAHAVSASPRSSEVIVTVVPRSATLGSRVVIDDCGTAVPAGARRALLALEVEPGTFGRPSSVSLFVANEVAAAQGAHLELGDAPVVDGKGGGLRVTLSFPR